MFVIPKEVQLISITNTTGKTIQIEAQAKKYEQLGYFIAGIKNEGILIDFTVTNDDIAGFCGISSRSSVNRMLKELRADGVITVKNHKFIIQDISYLLDQIAN